MMLHRLKLGLLALLVVLVSGCDDMLVETPEDFISPNQFYKTAADSRAALMGIYSEFLAVSLLGHRLGWGMELVSDAAEVGYLELCDCVWPYGTMRYGSDTRFMGFAWEDFYQVVARANLAIARIPDANASETVKNTMVGEAKFLRALAYGYLVRLWGDVPLITDAENPDLTPSRTPQEQVYAQIIKDATEAASALPVRAPETGRAPRGAALALLADIHLYRGDWQKAADYAKQVIDLGVYSLVPDYIKVFLPEYENGPEHIFTLQAEIGSAPSRFTNAYNPRELPRGKGGGNGIAIPTLWQYNSYIAGDYRQEVNYRQTWVDGNGKVWNLPRPHIWKYRPSSVSNINNGDVNPVVYRYGEILLIYAEALNELGRPNEAVRYLNMIRARARNGTGNEQRAQPADYSGPMDKASLRNAILQERAWELAHEPGKRWFDLKRQGVDYFMSQIAAHDPQAVGLEPTDMLWPIPLTETNVNPNIQQNPGY